MSVTSSVNPAENQCGLSSQSFPDTLEDALKVFEDFKTTRGVLLLNMNGFIIKSNMDHALSGMYCDICTRILTTIKINLKPLNKCGSTNRLRVIRTNSCSEELIIYPCVEQDFVLIIVQNPLDQSKVTQD